MNNKNLISIILIILAVICVIFNRQISTSFKKQSEKQEQSTLANPENNINPSVDNETEIIDIQINPPTELSYKLKENILEARANYIQNAIIHSDNYKPSEYIFGSIVSGKPWIANDICKDWQTKALKVNGPSEETRFINNPTILVAIEYPFSFSNYENISWCTDPVSTITPTKLTYEKSKNEITVSYKRLPFETENNHSFYTFNGVNARDLGYKYAYIDQSKTTYDKIVFQSDSNISNQIIEFQNFIHLGSSCQVPGGCNNGSPRQPYLEFKQQDTDYSNSDGIIYIKLWHNKPSAPSQKADITEKIIIQQY